MIADFSDGYSGSMKYSPPNKASRTSSYSSPVISPAANASSNCSMLLNTWSTKNIGKAIDVTGSHTMTSAATTHFV